VTSSLLPSQKNDFFRRIERVGLDPAAFHWGEISLCRRDQTSTFTVPALIHSASGYYFAFGGRGGGGDFYIYFSPDSRGHGWDPSETWGGVQGWFDRWAKHLRQELDERDLWDELLARRSALQSTTVADNTPFTGDERRRIAETLARIEAEVTRSNRFSAEQVRILHEKLDEMRSSAERLGRKDWQMFALGTLASIVISAAFAPDQARAVVEEVAQALAWLAAHAPKLP
jgi:uncharacterized protein YejL (UPF0352 family)